MLILDVKILNKPQEETLVGSVFSHINTSFTDMSAFQNKSLYVFLSVRISMEDPDDSCPEEIPGVKEALKNNDTAGAAKRIKEYLEKQTNVSLNIAITGESGAGKSTFINAFRGIKNRDEGAAPTGVTETTSEVTPYPHPDNPNLTLWDLPGIGTKDFPARKYLKLVGFDKYDFFLIISDTRFRENDVKLAQKIKKMKKISTLFAQRSTTISEPRKVFQTPAKRKLSQKSETTAFSDSKT
uniref:IRG-type G domain-containing protein n=1 Tax=Oreochromis niloticus TaxID=8128 RepID=A0A669DS85_ORENI